MNRRNFLSVLAKAAAGFTILPSAVTYQRQWKPNSTGIMVPFYEVVTDPDTGLTLSLQGIRPLAWWWAAKNFSKDEFMKYANHLEIVHGHASVRH
ncbi:MAG: hypothetical protein KGL39_03070 [Patescibacteria group bacterium]|nr:hypothetical protein [Patescibacteria group bacterium]